MVLSSAVSQKNCGLAIKAGDFITDARRSGLWPEAQPCTASAFSRARAKVPWEFFDHMLTDAVSFSDRLWQERSWEHWHGMHVYAIDGSTIELPAYPKIREEFDPTSGLTTPGKGHYPQCLQMTAYDVFRRQVRAMAIVPVGSSERDSAARLVPRLPFGVQLYDRGFPAYDFLRMLEQKCNGYFVVRCPAKGSFGAVARFIASGKQQDFIPISPPQGHSGPQLVVRAIRLESPDGTLSVLLTTMLDMHRFSLADIRDLYFRRWEVETHFRDEKITIAIERFHSRSPDGIRQELLAGAIMSVIARLLIMLCDSAQSQSQPHPQFKNAIMALAKDVLLLTAVEPAAALMVFEQLLVRIALVKYYQPDHPRPPQPRVCKRAPNKWILNRNK